MLNAVCLKDDELVAEYEKGKRISAIAKHHGVTNGAVLDALLKRKVVLNPSKLTKGDIKYCINWGYRHGSTVKELMLTYNVDKELIYGVLSLHGIDALPVPLTNGDPPKNAGKWVLASMDTWGLTKEQISEKYGVSSLKANAMYKTAQNFKESARARASKARSVEETKARSEAKKPKEPRKKYTPEEIELMIQLIQEGKTLTEVGAILGRNPKTLSQYFVKRKVTKAGIIANDKEMIERLKGKILKSGKKSTKSSKSNAEAEKRAYLDKHYGVGCWKKVTRTEFKNLMLYGNIYGEDFMD